jgi:hypothetical protein
MSALTLGLIQYIEDPIVTLTLTFDLEATKPTRKLLVESAFSKIP